MLELKESLNCGGTLRVTKDSWEITYYLPGPDRRYNPKFYTIHGVSVAQYVMALNRNFAEYEKLKEVFADQENFSKTLDQGMTIHMMRKLPSFNGLHLSSHKQPISTRFQLEKLTETYTNAIEKAKKMQLLLRSM